MIYRKLLLAPGTYTLRDGRRVTFAPADVRSLAARVRAMTTLGQFPPLTDEHQFSAVAMSKSSAHARLTPPLGFLDGAEVDGKHRLWGLFDVQDPAAVRKVKKVKHVSIYVEPNAYDGDGRKWAGPSLTHVALTTQPAMPQSDEFLPVAMSRLAECAGRGIALSLADQERNMADDYADTDLDEGAADLGELLDAIAEGAKVAKEKLSGVPAGFVKDVVEHLEEVKVCLEALAQGEMPDNLGGQASEPQAESPQFMAMSRKDRAKALRSRSEVEDAGDYLIRMSGRTPTPRTPA